MLQNAELKEIGVTAKQMWWQIALLSAMNFIAVPTGYMFAKMQLKYVAYMALLLHLAAATCWQKKLVQKLLDTVLTMEGACHDVRQKYMGKYVMPVVGWAMPLTHGIAALIIALAEAADPMLDEVTAGSADSEINAHAKVFADSWRGRVKPFGDIIADAGLPATLTFIVIFSTWSQIFLCGNNLLRIKCCALEDAFKMSLTDLQCFANACEIASVCVLAAVCEELYVAMKADTGAEHARDEGTSTFKLLGKGFIENVPSAWFSITLLSLGLTVGTMDGTTAAVTVASIAASLASLAKCCYIYAKDGYSELMYHAYNSSKIKTLSFASLKCFYVMMELCSSQRWSQSSSAQWFVRCSKRRCSA